MAAAGNIYANFLPQCMSKNVNLTSDSLKMALLNGYVPDLVNHIHWSDVSGSEVTGTGYTAGGVALTSPTLTLTAANSWSLARANSTAYAYGQVIRPATGNGFLYRAVVSGTSAGSIPTYPTVVGTTVVDGGVTWACLGDAALVFSSATVQWTGATFNATHAVIYDVQSGVSSTEPLIVLQTFASTQSPANQTFQVIPDPTLGWFIFSPPS